MMESQFDLWQRIHRDLFGLHSADDVRMVGLWDGSLSGYTFEELRDASFAIAADPTERARFRANHLAMIHEFVHARRADTAARERARQDREYASAACANCHGVGVVRVPNADFIVDGAFTREFFVEVACACGVGAARFNAINARLAAAESDRRILDLAQYEAMVPDWRLILAAADEADEHERAAEDLASQVDRTAGPIDTQTIAERIRRP